MDEAFQIVWTQSSNSDLDDILDYIAGRDSIDRALELYENLRKRIATLSSLPQRCRYVPELKAIGLMDFRELIFPPYRIFFRLVEKKVVLLGVLDSRRDLEEILIQRALES